MEAQATEEDVTKRPTKSRQDAALLLCFDNVRVHQILGVAVVLVVGVCCQELQVLVIRVAVEKFTACLVNHLTIGVQTRIFDSGLGLGLCDEVGLASALSLLVMRGLRACITALAER